MTTDEEAAALAARIVAVGISRALSVAVAESLTGGAVCSAIVSVPGASAVLRGGVVSYATDLKASLLGVDPALLTERGAVDADVAVAMAAGVRRIAHADVAVAITGVAGPAGQDGRAAGVVFVAVADPTGTRVKELHLPGGRAVVRAGAVHAALAALLGALSVIPDGPAVPDGPGDAPPRS